MKKTVLTWIVKGHHNVIIDELLALLHNCLKMLKSFSEEIVEYQTWKIFLDPSRTCIKSSNIDPVMSKTKVKLLFPLVSSRTASWDR